MLGTGAFDDVGDPGEGIVKTDVRGIIDGSGNRETEIRKIIDHCLCMIEQGQKVVLCCDYGRSRSNALAAAVLARCTDCCYSHAIKQVCEAVETADIDVRFATEVEQAVADSSTPVSMTGDGATEILIVGDSPLGVLLARDMHKENRSVRQISQSRVNQAALYAEVRSFQCDVVVDCFLPSDFNSTESLGKRVALTKDLVEVCLTSGARLLHCSSFEVFDQYVSAEMVVNESAPLYPRSNYGWACTISENLIDNSVRTAGLKATVLRMSRVFGPHFDSRRLPMRFVSSLKDGSAVQTHECPNGAPALDLLFESDAVRAISAALVARSDGIFNIGTGHLTTTYGIAEMLSKALGLSSRIDVIPVDRPASNIALDATKAKKLLNWEPKVSVEEGFQRVAATDSDHVDSSS